MDGMLSSYRENLSNAGYYSASPLGYDAIQTVRPTDLGLHIDEPNRKRWKSTVTIFLHLLVKGTELVHLFKSIDRCTCFSGNRRAKGVDNRDIEIK